MNVNKDYEINLDEIIANPTEMTPATYQYYKKSEESYNYYQRPDYR